MSRARALSKAYHALAKKYKAGRSFGGGTRVQGAARSAAGKAQSVASASAGRGMPVPTLSTSTRNALKIGRRQVAAQQGVHYKRAVMPDYMQSMHRVRQRAIRAYGSAPNPLGPVARKSRKRSIKRRRRK